MLAFCAAPRAQHLLRNIPPADILPYARAHDDAVWAVVQGLLGDQGPGEGDAWAAARSLAFLPPSLGGLGLFAAERVAPVAYWAAWADALLVLRQRYPDAADRLVRELEGAPSAPVVVVVVAGAVEVRPDEARTVGTLPARSCGGGALAYCGGLGEHTRLGVLRPRR